MISVIVPTRNRADLLAGTLDSLSQQDMPLDRFEVLVVNNGSTDHTPQVIGNYAQVLPNLGHLEAPEPGLHVGRHAGMLAARSDILVFADDDIEATPTWLSSISEVFEDPEVALAGGSNHPKYLETPPAWLVRLWDRSATPDYKAITALSVIEFSGSAREISPYLIWGCNFAVRKKILEAAGGFHPDGVPQSLIRFRGDGETYISCFVEESGLKAMFHPGASIFHKITPDRMTFDYFRQRGFRQGVSDSYTQLRSQGHARPISRGRFLRRVRSWARNRLTGLEIGPDARHALAQWKIGHAEGFKYHQAIYRDDPVVREWVHKEKYY